MFELPLHPDLEFPLTIKGKGQNTDPYVKEGEGSVNHIVVGRG